MTSEERNTVYTTIGTQADDTIAIFDQTDANASSGEDAFEATKVNGLEGDDTISTAQTDDLAAGDMVGDEWTYVNGKWVYNADAVVVSAYGADKSYNDIITTGEGNDVLLGNGGDDSLYAGSGDDIVNAGRGNDLAFGGHGDDVINLEDGNDLTEAGYGDDTVNAGNGDDVVYGDVKGDNLLEEDASSASTFEDMAQNGAWTMVDSHGEASIAQSVETVAGETYTISFDLAANLAGGHATGKVEVLWNGDVIDTVEATSGAFETFQVDVVSTGNEGELTFRALTPEDSTQYNFDGPIISYDKTMSIGGSDVDVAAFAAGQAKLYQVIDGQLNVFDVNEKEYIAVGDQPDFRINAVGFNIEEDMIYGVAKSSGFDTAGNAVASSDIVMIDAAGDTYRIGEGFYGDYVGDFDDSGNLWTFHTSMNRVSVVDVNEFDADGNPVISHYNLPNNLFNDRTYDVAFNGKDGNFYAVVPPKTNGGDGKVVKIDMSMLENGGMPTFTEITITGTLYGDTMDAGMAKGAFGAVFLDGEGNLYYGLNKGDHDLDASTDVEGAIFKVNMDWDAGQAYAEFMSEAPSTGSNDGAVDPRSTDAFTEIDADAAVLIREPELTLVDGGNDVLNGGAGNDEMHGNAGSDTLNGGEGEDALYGDQGNDIINAGQDDDWASGGIGDDKMRGESGNDVLFGDEGKDYLHGGSGNDQLNGGSGIDKIVGGTGSDTIDGGAGNDHLWGGEWSKDDSADTFVFGFGTGKDYVHDFEADHDVIDLSSFKTNLEDVAAVTTDLGWATVIDLQQLDGGLDGDRLVLKSVEASSLDVDSFVF
ncbi:calcium-binding protein [Rhodophyticola sp. CCM32]|uniref:calcium-binding protein n=1 Tax=Rhodophyticola sp. CCM32 TaxID=2916397 RepID=UPI00143D0532|nr:calcium-binding protein [Rhodophyticola sp. CCM32]